MRWSRLFRIDFRWFIVIVCLLSAYNWKQFRRVDLQTKPIKDDAAALNMPALPHYVNHTATSSSSNATRHPVSNGNQQANSNRPPLSPLKFFIIAPPEVTTWLVENHTEKASRYYENHLNEESAEVWLHRGFEQMTYEEGHTSDPAEADVFLIAAYLHLHAAIHKKQGKHKRGEKPDHSFVRLYRRLIGHPSKPHLLLIPSWNPGISETVGIKSLTKALKERSVNLWSLGFERNEMWQGVAPERILPIPYVVRPSESREGSEQIVAAGPRTKNFVFYAGDVRRNAKAWAGCHRDRLILPLENETDMDVRLVTKKNRLNQTDYNYRMSSSEYCLILCGDTPSSRSLTSAMMSGCIPVRVGSRLRGLCEPPCKRGYGWRPTGPENPHLPFPDQISWEDFPEVDEEKFIESGRQVMDDLFLKFDEAKKRDIRSTLRRVHNSWIYGWGNPVNSTDFGGAVNYIWKTVVAVLQSKTLSHAQQATSANV
jgi:hypothetical protein